MPICYKLCGLNQCRIAPFSDYAMQFVARWSSQFECRADFSPQSVGIRRCLFACMYGIRLRRFFCGPSSYPWTEFRATLHLLFSCKVGSYIKEQTHRFHEQLLHGVSNCVAHPSFKFLRLYLKRGQILQNAPCASTNAFLLTANHSVPISEAKNENVSFRRRGQNGGVNSDVDVHSSNRKAARAALGVNRS